MMQKAFVGCEWETIQVEGLPYVFKTTNITSSHLKDYSIIAACANKPGICATSILSSTMYNHFGVGTIFMTGITAGIDNGDIALDDIIIADAIHDYASGKLKEQVSGDIKFLKEMNQIPANHSLIALVAEFISDPVHLRDINDSIHDANLKMKIKCVCLYSQNSLWSFCCCFFVCRKRLTRGRAKITST